MNCFFCGQKYDISIEHMNGYTTEGFCSNECMNEDNKRLVEGNKIIQQAEVQLSDINKLRLDMAGINPLSNIVAGGATSTILRFGSRAEGSRHIDNENQDQSQSNFCSKHGLFKVTDQNVCLKCETFVDGNKDQQEEQLKRSELDKFHEEND